MYSCARETYELLDATKGDLSREEEKMQMMEKKSRRTRRHQKANEEDEHFDSYQNLQAGPSNAGDGSRSLDSSKPQFIVKKADVKAAFGVVLHSINAFKSFKVI